MGVRLWIWNKRSVIPMKTPWRDRTKRSMLSSFECQGSPYYLLLLQQQSLLWILPLGHIVNEQYYLYVLCCLHEALLKNQSELSTNNSWFMHYNGNAYTSLPIYIFPLKNNIHHCDGTAKLFMTYSPFVTFLVSKHEGHAETITSVSYTHLDVYKRQIIQILSPI